MVQKEYFIVKSRYTSEAEENFKNKELINLMKSLL